jgi:hypothetical protein
MGKKVKITERVYSGGVPLSHNRFIETTHGHMEGFVTTKYGIVSFYSTHLLPNAKHQMLLLGFVYAGCLHQREFDRTYLSQRSIITKARQFAREVRHKYYLPDATAGGVG